MYSDDNFTKQGKIGKIIIILIIIISLHLEFMGKKIMNVVEINPCSAILAAIFIYMPKTAAMET